jgi:hypothetical protein
VKNESPADYGQRKAATSENCRDTSPVPRYVGTLFALGSELLHLLWPFTFLGLLPSMGKRQVTKFVDVRELPCANRRSRQVKTIER